MRLARLLSTGLVCGAALACSSTTTAGESERAGAGGHESELSGGAGAALSDAGGGGAVLSGAGGAGGAALGGAGGVPASTGGNAGASAASSGGAGELSGACPASPPATGAPCTLPDGPATTWTCSWGDHPALDCRTIGRCDTSSKWTVTPPPAECAGLVAGCPATKTEACSAASDARCIYPDGSSCACVGASRTPLCPLPITVASGCPNLVPNQGAPCATPNQVCGSRACMTPSAVGIKVTCVQGVWQWVSDASCFQVCTSPDTPIATPTGERPIATLQVGDLVYSVDHDAVRVVPIVQLRRRPARDHYVQRVEMAGGRVLEISAPHPTADGRYFGDLRAGQLLDGHVLTSVERVPFLHDATYDILPASDTGYYFAAGALIGSTLRPTRSALACQAAE